MNLTPDQLDDLGKIADKADNYIVATQMQLPASLHIEALKGGMESISEEIKKLYEAVSGENPWVR